MAEKKFQKPNRVPCGGRVVSSFPNILSSSGQGKSSSLLACLPRGNPPVIQFVDRDSLEPVALFPIRDVVGAHCHLVSEHCEWDSVNKEYVGLATEIRTGLFRNQFLYHFWSVSAERKSIQLVGEPIQLPTLNIVHGFGVTAHYILLPIFPYSTYGLGKLQQFLRGSSSVSTFSFNPSIPIEFHLMSRSSGKRVAVFKSSQAGFCMNIVNAYENEQADSLVFDLVLYDNVSILTHFDVAYLKSTENAVPKSTLTRFTIPNLSSYRENQTALVVKQPLTGEPLTGTCLELPCINSHRRGKSHRYVYGVSLNDVSSTPVPLKLWDSVHKVDVQTKKVVARWGLPGVFPSEPRFIAEPERKEEDAGVLLVQCTATQDSSSSSSRTEPARPKTILVGLDAKSLKQLFKCELPTSLTEIRTSVVHGKQDHTLEIPPVPFSFERGSWSFFK